MHDISSIVFCCLLAKGFFSVCLLIHMHHFFKDRENITGKNFGAFCECSFCYCWCNHSHSGKFFLSFVLLWRCMTCIGVWQYRFCCYLMLNQLIFKISDLRLFVRHFDFLNGWLVFFFFNFCVICIISLFSSYL